MPFLVHVYTVMSASQFNLNWSWQVTQTIFTVIDQLIWFINWFVDWFDQLIYSAIHFDFMSFCFLNWFNKKAQIKWESNEKHQTLHGIIWNRTKPRVPVQNQPTRELIGTWKTSHKQQRHESPTVTLTWYASKYKVHKLQQLYILVEFVYLLFTHMPVESYHRCTSWWSLHSLYLLVCQVRIYRRQLRSLLCLCLFPYLLIGHGILYFIKWMKMYTKH